MYRQDLAGLVLARTLRQGFLIFKPRMMYSEIFCFRGESPTHMKPPFPTTVISIVTGAEANNARPPHLRRFTC